MRHRPWVPLLVIGINLLVWGGLVHFGAPWEIIVGGGILCLLIIGVHVWMLIKKPEQRLVLREDSLTFVDVWSSTTLSFAEMATAELKRDYTADTSSFVLHLTDARGKTIHVHSGFLQLPEGIVPFVEEKLKAVGKQLDRDLS